MRQRAWSATRASIRRYPSVMDARCRLSVARDRERPHLADDANEAGLSLRAAPRSRATWLVADAAAGPSRCLWDRWFDPSDSRRRTAPCVDVSEIDVW